MERKFGAGDRIKKTHEHLTALGAELGIPFAFDRIKVSPNTLDAHRLIRWAAEPGAQDDDRRGAFPRLFRRGAQYRRPRRCSPTSRTPSGMDQAGIAARLATDEDRAEVQADIRSAQRIGVTGVPTFIVANRYGLVGAQPPEELARAFVAATDEIAASRTGTAA